MTLTAASTSLIRRTITRRVILQIFSRLPVRSRRPKLTDAYTKAVLTVIAVALVVLAVRPIIEPGRVDAQGPKLRDQFGSEGNDAAFELLSRRLDKLEHNTGVIRSAGNTNAHRTNVRFSRAGWGVDVVLVDADAAGVMGARSEPAIQTPEQPNPF